MQRGQVMKSRFPASLNFSALLEPDRDGTERAGVEGKVGKVVSDPSGLLPLVRSVLSYVFGKPAEFISVGDERGEA